MAFNTARSVAKAKVPEARRGIVKQVKTKIPTWLYVNAAAGFVATSIVVLAIRGVLIVEPIMPCSERIATGTVFGLQSKAGGPVSASDLQSRLGGRDWGMLENASVQSVKDGPAPVAMHVALPKLATGTSASSARSGMGFTWLLPKLAGADTACLTYELWLPEDFEFGKGGTLPGIFGGETLEVPGKAAPGFATRNAWGENGAMFVRYTSDGDARENTLAIDPDNLRLDRGRWLRIEQEIILNEPGTNNGQFRLWVDGKVRYDEGGIMFRKTAAAQFRGVVADVHYGANGADAAAIPKGRNSLRITPFVLRWQ